MTVFDSFARKALNARWSIGYPNLTVVKDGILEDYALSSAMQDLPHIMIAAGPVAWQFSDILDHCVFGGIPSRTIVDGARQFAG